MTQGRLHSISQAQVTQQTNREKTRNSKGRWSSSSLGMNTRIRRGSRREMPMKEISLIRTMVGNHIIRMNIIKPDRVVVVGEMVVGTLRTMISRVERTHKRRHTMMIMEVNHTRRRKRLLTSWNRKTHSQFPILSQSQSQSNKRMNIL